MFSFENFVSLEFILSFAGMVILVSLLTQFTKRLFDKIVENHTKYLVYGWSFLLCLFAGVWLGKFSTSREIVETCVIWLINSVVVWFTAMKAYETVTGGGDNNVSKNP
jgi:hypothetical protein